MNPGQSHSLQQIAETSQWFVAYSLNHFLPETILLVGFLLSILLDLLFRRTAYKTLSAYLALAVLIAAGVAAFLQWSAFDPMHGKNWEGGALIFPYTQTLFAPRVTNGNVAANYAMLVADNFAVYFKLLIALSGILVVLMSLASRELSLRKRHFGEYYSLILAMSFGMFLMPASTDLLMMYLSLELVSIAGYVLAGFSKENAKGSEASMKYLLFGALSSGLMIYGFSLIYGLTGTTNVIGIRQILSLSIVEGGVANQGMLIVAAVLALAGMTYKIGAVPFHFWTPDVYEGAPTPVTALLSTASKAAGFGLLLRFTLFTFPFNSSTGLPIIDWPLMLAILATATMVLGNLAALLQSNVKRMLAYSSIAHAGYVLVGVVVAGSQVSTIGMGPGAGDPGIVSVLVYLATYLFMNLGAFAAVMLIANKIGSEEIDDYRGLVQRSPFVCVALAIFLISLTGIPLTAGFIGKFYIFTAALQPHQETQDIRWVWLVVVAVLNTVLSIYYYLRVIGAMFLKRSAKEQVLGTHLGEGALQLADAPFSYSIATKAYLVLLLIPVIGLGIYFQPLVDFASGVIRFFSFETF